MESSGRCIWYDEIDGAVSASREADLVWLTTRMLKREDLNRVLDRATRLRWVHLSMSGVDFLDLPAIARAGVILTNGAGIAAEPIAEHVIMCMLAANRGFGELLLAQSTGTWARPATAQRELGGSRALIIGYGHLGRAVAVKSRALGVDVVAARLHETDEPGVVAGQAWRQVLPSADFVVLCVPLTPHTRHMIGAAELANMKPDAWLINVGRGGLVDEDALVSSLHAGTIGGAALDVVQQEPLPPEHALWRAPRILITPHVSWISQRTDERAIHLFTLRLRQFVEAPGSMPLVDLTAGY